jgi:two-component system, NtrC family, sensor kinase
LDIGSSRRRAVQSAGPWTSPCSERAHVSDCYNPVAVKLALKLAVAVMPGALAIIATAAFLDLRLDRDELDADQLADDLSLARVVVRSVGETWEAAGEQRARAMMVELDASEPRFRLRWVDLGGDAARLSGEERARLQRGEEVLRHPNDDKPDWLHIVSPVRVHGTVAGAIELAEAPPDLQVHKRRAVWATIVTTLALSATMVLVTLLVGAWVVGRPITALISQARRVAAGDLGARSTPRQRDELGELTREVNGMLDRLETASATVRASTEQRFAALEQLRHAERLTTVGRLATSVAHELGTPLNVVAGRARLVTENAGEAPAHARIIIDQTERMTKIIRQLLDYARRRPPQKGNHDLKLPIVDVLSLVQTLASKKGVALRFSSDLAEAPVVADPTQIQQALTNLVVNAIQASRDGGQVDVVLRATRAPRKRSAPPPPDPAPRDGFEVAVRDHGPGMPADVLARVFEPFFTTKPVGESTGLGLSVANDIVEEHGGWIDAESVPGRGSRFSMFLPRGAA